MRTAIALVLAVLSPSVALADDALPASHEVTTVIRERAPEQSQEKTQAPAPQEKAAEKPAEPPPPPKNGYVAPHFVAYEGGAVPPDASLVTRPNYTLVGAGLGIFGATYTASVISAVAACGPQADCTATPSAAWLYLPIVGPFITAATATSTGGAALAAFDGALQLTGATLAIVGVIARRKFVMWQDKTSTVTVMPTASNNSAGLALTVTHL